MKKLLLLFCFVLIGNIAFSQHKAQSPLRDLEVQVRSCGGFNGEVEVELLIASLDKDQRLFFEQLYSSAVDEKATVMKLINLGLMTGTYGTMTPRPIKIKDVTINKE